VEINGRPIKNYLEIQEAVAPEAEKELAVRVERNGTTLNLGVTPAMDKSTGAGKIGVYYWADPVIGAVAAGSPAAIAGLKPGDRILNINGEDLPYTVGLIALLRNQPSVLSLEFERNGAARQTELILSYTDAGPDDMGISYQGVRYRTPRLSVPAALAKGAVETWKTFILSVRSLSLLFRGIDLTQAVSGPVRITYMMGDVAAEGFGQSFGTGLSTMANFLALISIALCIMNLLPLPVLDGGMIVLFLVEAIKRKPLSPRAVYAFQTVGVVLIFGLMIFAVFGDILFLVRR
jgi:regulator of sigma E protease